MHAPAPFLLPADAPAIVHVLDLPVPPSTNRLWAHGRGRVFKSKDYAQWLEDAGMALLLDRKLGRRETITGKFTAIIQVARDVTKGDLDNIPKALFDICQRYQFISNDVNLKEYAVKWTDDSAPRGCRITLRSVQG